MIIDAHAHASGDFLIGEKIVRILDREKVDKVILVPGELGSTKNYSLPELAARYPNRDVVSFTNMLTKLIIGITGKARQIEEGNKYVYSLVKEFPDRIIQFYWIRISIPGALNRIKQDYDEYGFKGIKLHQCWEYFKVESEEFDEIAEWAAERKLPVFIHLFSGKQATQLAEYIKEHDKTTFIIGHLFGLEHYIEADIPSENVYFEISTPQLISLQRLSKSIQHFGANRVLMGSDTPYGQDNLKRNIERIMHLDIPDNEKKLILGENTKRLLGT